MLRRFNHDVPAVWILIELERDKARAFFDLPLPDDWTPELRDGLMRRLVDWIAAHPGGEQLALSLVEAFPDSLKHDRETA
jgi:hypothetical protein